jgi:S-DNA-T family DNA segregation ATPase FtsK/SpoIIIE
VSQEPGILTFHRPARVFPDPVPTDPVDVAPPPTVPQSTGGTWLQVLLPIVGSLAIVGFALIYRNVLFLAVAGGVAILMALLYIAIRAQASRQGRRRRRDSAQRYRVYLQETRERLEDIAGRQRKRLGRLHPDTGRIWSWVTDRRYLWERRREDPDFLEVRVGVGEVALAAPVRLDLGGNPLTEYEADLLQEAQDLVDDYEVLEMAPVAVPAHELGVLAVVGWPEGARALTRFMVCELAAFTAPEDLRVVAYFDPRARDDWEWMKWLPHTRESWVARGEEGRQGVSLTSDPSDLEIILAQLVRPRLEHLDRVREAGLLGQHDVSFQQVVVIVDGYEPQGPTGQLGVLDELLARASEIGVLVVPLCARPEDVPSTAGAVMELAEGGWLSYVETRPDGRREHNVRADAAEVELCEALARTMAPLRLRSRRGRTSTVDSEGLLDLLGLGSAESLEPPATWAASDGQLRAPIGVGEDGSPVSLDLKEAAEGGMGPHGLMVGATGSGKSELLRTLVTGLALTHAPEDLAFVLVDYKGGATFAELGALPHVAGMITNLERDLTLVDRMHEALFGELERRQRLLQDAGGFDRVREYQEHRLRHPEQELPPLPTLLIVVDEFGELLTTRPDFLDLFVSIGRTGRSLGMHLLLATQRLDEGRIRGLEGHLRYRICLRTFSADESLVALGTRDAFELPPLPGVGFLRVDAGTQRFKAALATRPFRRARQVAAGGDVVREFEPSGPGVELAVVGGPPPADIPAPAPGDGRRVRTEMQVVVEAMAAARDRRARQVWLPPLPAALSLDAVLEAVPDEDRRPGTPGWLRVPIGLLDRPREQVQVPYRVAFTGTGGHLAVVGAPRAGKSTALQALAAGLALTHDPRDVHVYAVDLGGGGLHALAGLPHVGAVYGRGEREGIHRLMREIEAILADRAEAFRRAGLDGMPAYHRARLEKRLPARYGEVFLFVDNWSLLAQDFEDLEQRLAHVVATGLHYGVHVIISANRWNDIRLAVRDNIGGRLELRLNDPIESEVDRHAAASLPDETPGRGIVRSGEQVQVALPRVDARADPGGLAVGIEGLVEGAAGRWRGSPVAPPVRMLPRAVHARDLPDPAADPEPGVAIGIEEFGLEPVRVDLLEGDPHFLVFGDAECGKTTLLRGWIQRTAAAYPPERVRLAVVDFRRLLLGAADDRHLVGYAVTPDAAGDLAGRLAAELSARLPGGVSPARPGQWEGPHLILFVDDYDLVAGTGGSPLSPLVDFLAQGRDIGFHVVLARRAAGTARSAFEPVLQRIRELGTPGLVMSGDPGEGPLIEDRKAEPLPPGRGFLVRRRRVSQVHTLLTPAEEAATTVRRGGTG